MSITTTEYSSFERAYDDFNVHLFNGELPPCLITLQRKSKAMGYFHRSRFQARSGNGRTDEIALNPDYFAGFPDLEVLDTLAHEMCHLWQHHFGKPSRAGYHNREWARKMIAIGLMPSSTGQPGGAQTGQQVSDYPIEGGLFLGVARQLMADGFRVNWESLPLGQQSGQADGGKRKSKVKYTCGRCGQNAWAKPDSLLLCGTCLVPLVNRV